MPRFILDAAKTVCASGKVMLILRTCWSASLHHAVLYPTDVLCGLVAHRVQAWHTALLLFFSYFRSCKRATTWSISHKGFMPSAEFDMQFLAAVH